MVSGLHIQYFLICKRKLWLYAKNIGFEEEHERVLDGKLLHNKSYNYLKDKEIMIDNSFKIDRLDGEYVREVKLSRKMTEADRYQLLFYLYELKKRGLVRKGLISYPREKKTEEVILTREDEKKLKIMKKEIEKIIQMDIAPPLVQKPYCKAAHTLTFAMQRKLRRGNND